MATSTYPGPRLVRLVAGLLVPLFLLGTVSLTKELFAQQPPDKKKKEEEEEPAKKPKGKGEEEEEGTKRKPNKVIRVDDEPPAGKPGARPGLSDAVDIVTLFRQSKDAAVRDFLYSLLEPHEVIRTKSDRTKRVALLDRYLGNPPRFVGRIKMHVFQDSDWQEERIADYSSTELAGITYYEQVAIARVDEFLDPSRKLAPPRHELLRAAGVALSSVLATHESARQQSKRNGDEFDKLAKDVRDKLLNVEIDEIQALADANDWDNAFELARRVADAYPAAEEQQRIVGPLAKVINQLVQAGNVSDDQMRVIQGRIQQLMERFPNGLAGLPVQAKMREHAQDLFDRAKALDQKKQSKEALALLKQAEGFYPRLPGLHDYRLRLDNALAELRVGVRELPENLAPSLAFADADKQAVELLYESLVKQVLEPDGGLHYGPGLADGRPRLVPLGRQFQLVRDAYWSNDQPVTAADVRNTVRLLKDPKWSGYSPAWQEMVDDPLGGADPSRVTLTLRQGFMDPLLLMSFKVLPAEPWPGHKLTVQDDTRLAKTPVGSGPYVYGGRKKTKAGREYVSFPASSNYGSRAGRTDLPRIREIQFFQSDDPVKDLQNGNLDFIPDLPADKVKVVQEAAKSYKVLGPMPNRRIYFLAVNNHNPVLANADVRKAIAHAIDREALLNDFFRAGLDKNVHRALNGPFPPNTWASDPALTYNKALAKSHMAAAEKAGNSKIELSLKYANNDMQAARAMEALRAQLQAEIGVTLTLEPLPPAELRIAVEGTQRYDLAYYHYDYGSEMYWLWPLFHPAGVGVNGTNYLSYVNDGAMVAQFQQINVRCEFTEVQKCSRVLHGMFFDKMPFVPLWQLDTFAVLHPNLQTVPFDPLLVFTDIERWTLEKK
jgi:peptide/nickel transport system substrate-binding protein